MRDRAYEYLNRDRLHHIDMLEVLPEYRRRGIAYSLEAAMINRLREQKRIPYAQIFTTNSDSVFLQKNLE